MLSARLPRLLSVRETAERLAIRESTLRAWLRLRRLPKVRLGGRSIRVPADAVEALVREGFMPADETVVAAARAERTRRKKA